MINKSDSRCAVVRFCYHSYDYRPNWTSLSPITITYINNTVKRPGQTDSQVAASWTCEETCVGWPNGKNLALTCMQIWSRPRWSQVHASAHKAWPNGVASRPKFQLETTCESVWPGLNKLRLSDQMFFFSPLTEFGRNPQTSRLLKEFRRDREPQPQPRSQGPLLPVPWSGRQGWITSAHVHSYGARRLDMTTIWLKMAAISKFCE